MNIHIIGNDETIEQKKNLAKLEINCDNLSVINNNYDILILSQCDKKPNKNFISFAEKALLNNKDVWIVGNKNNNISNIYSNSNISFFDNWFQIYSEIHPI